MLLPTLLLLGQSAAFADWIDRNSCPITIASADAVAGPMSSSERKAWYGSNALAVLIAKDGRWHGMGPENDYRDKFWWWHDTQLRRMSRNVSELNCNKSIAF